jgi:hypothetical protein
MRRDIFLRIQEAKKAMVMDRVVRAGASQRYNNSLPTIEEESDESDVVF